MATVTHITASYLRSRIDYDPETGVFTWKERPVRCRNDKVWNAKYAGRTAGATDTKGHIQIKIDRKAYFAHRLAWFLQYGQWPDGEIDHKNRIRDDNRLINLRSATSAQNSANMKTPETNTSGVRGVRWQQYGWRAQISVRGKKIHLGMFDTKEAASEAYRAAADKFHGEFAFKEEA